MIELSLAIDESTFPMNISGPITYLSILTLFALGSCQPDVRQPPDFFSTADRPYTDVLEPLVENAIAATPVFWLASFYSIKPEPCSGTVIGNKVVLIAAHCLRQNKQVTLIIRNKRIKADCTIAPGYHDGDKHKDIAVCELSEPVRVPFETISTNTKYTEVGKKVYLTGFGCEDPSKPPESSSNRFVFRYGGTKLHRVTAESDFLVTRGKVALCLGDSGGGTYVFFDDSESGSRRLVGVNSFVGHPFSYITRLDKKWAADFLKSWSEKRNLKICGLHADATGCRT